LHDDDNGIVDRGGTDFEPDAWLAREQAQDDVHAPVMRNPEEIDQDEGVNGRYEILEQDLFRAPDNVEDDPGTHDVGIEQKDVTKHGVMVNQMASRSDSGSRSSLPSFEGTPMPPKLSYDAWRAAKLQMPTSRSSSRHDVQLTSSTFLDPDLPAPGSGYVAACLAVRDAHDDIAEWVRHHLKLGIFPLYVYDHGSVPPLSSVLRPYIDAGAVVYTHFETFSHPSGRPQLFAFDACLRQHGPSHHWMVFIDVDEFLIFRDGPPVQSLSALLKQYEQYSALAVHWILFGSSGYESRPLQGTLRSYTRCLPLNHTQHLFVKTIANTKCTTGTSDSPHAFIHNCTAPVVRIDGSVIRGPTADDLPVHSTLAIHHYAIKSEEEFEVKMLKGSGMLRQRGWEYFYFVDGWSVDFNLDGLVAWDDDIETLPRIIDPQTLSKQLSRYASEAHEDFWRAAAGRKGQTKQQQQQQQQGVRTVRQHGLHTKEQDEGDAAHGVPRE